jgi:hypothetical protein
MLLSYHRIDAGKGDASSPIAAMGPACGRRTGESLTGVACQRHRGILGELTKRNVKLMVAEFEFDLSDRASGRRKIAKSQGSAWW